MSALAAEGVTRFLEVGPDTTLTALARTCVPDDQGLLFLPVQRKQGAEARNLVGAFARLHLHGAAVSWPALLPGADVVDLPTYAFRRDRYWLQRSYTEDGAAAVPSPCPGRITRSFGLRLRGFPKPRGCPAAGCSSGPPRSTATTPGTTR